MIHKPTIISLLFLFGIVSSFQIS